MDNGLHKSLSKGNLTIEVSYRPADLVWRNELRKAVDEMVQDQLRKDYDSLNYFILRFSKNGEEIESAFVGSPTKFEEVTNYLAFGMQQHLIQVNGEDSSRVLDVIHTRTFGTSHGSSVMAIFNGNLKHKDNSVKLYLNDAVLGIGTAEFEFKISDIKNTPPLTLN